MEWINQSVNFPDPTEGTRGIRVLEKANPQTLLDLCLALGEYADAAPDLLSKAGRRRAARVGNFLPRKACQVDLVVRIWTGLRPSVVELIEVADGAHFDPAIPTMWAIDNGYRIHVPAPAMKHRKRGIHRLGRGSILSRSGRGRRSQPESRGYDFLIVDPSAVRVISDYLENGWRQAIPVLENRTRRLLLSRNGDRFADDSFGHAVHGITMHAIEAYRVRHGVTLPRLPRNAHRHVIGEYLRRYDSSQPFKSWYLTHSPCKGSDRNYGDHEAAALRAAIAAVLEGQLPIAEQLAAERARNAAKIDELLALVGSMARQLAQRQVDGPSAPGVPD
jgi:hypothetical protein